MEEMLRRRAHVLMVDLAGLELGVNKMERRLITTEDEIQAEFERQLTLPGPIVLTEDLNHLLKLAEIQRNALQAAREVITIKSEQVAAARVMLINYVNDHMDTLTNGLQNLATTTNLIHHMQAIIPQSETTVIPQNGTTATDHTSHIENEVANPNVEATGVAGNPTPVIGLLEAKTNGNSDDSVNSGEEDTIHLNTEPNLYKTHLQRNKKFPTIVQDKNGKWYELHCKLCGTNVGDNPRNWLSGTLGLGRHLAKDHCLTRPWTMDMHNYILQILANANKREINQDELKRIESDPTYKLSKVVRSQSLSNGQNSTDASDQAASQGQTATQGQTVAQGQTAAQGQTSTQTQAAGPLVRYSLRSLFRP